MKKIYFIRHAKSSWKEPYCSDFDRGLNKRGKGDVPKMAQRLKNGNIFPQLIITSPAVRAKKTAKGIGKVLGCENIIKEIKLYDSSFDQYLDVIKHIDDKYENVFIFGHNFTITDVCERLSNAMIGNMPTCSVVGIGFEVESFNQIEVKSGKLLFFDFPKNESMVDYLKLGKK